MPVKRGDWKKATPLPAASATIAFEGQFSQEEFARLAEGHRPQGMEEKWFTYYEEPWLFLHRSWTGHCIYQVRFEACDGGFRVVEVLVSRDFEQYQSNDAEFDAAALAVQLDQHAGRDARGSWDQLRALWDRARQNRPADDSPS